MLVYISNVTCRTKQNFILLDAKWMKWQCVYHRDYALGPYRQKYSVRHLGNVFCIFLSSSYSGGDVPIRIGIGIVCVRGGITDNNDKSGMTKLNIQTKLGKLNFLIIQFGWDKH